MPFQPIAHGDEGLGGAAHFGGAVRLEVGHGAALAETVGGAGQPLDGPHLVAQEDDGDAHQQQRGAHHPEDEDVGLGDGDPVARHQHRQHAVLHIHLYLEIIADAGGAEIAVGADALFQDIVQRQVDGAGQLAAIGRDIITPQKTDAVIELARRQRPQAFALGALVIVFQRHQQRHVGGHVARQPSGGGVQVALEKHVSDDRLQDHDRRHDDDQRAAEQSARQKALDGKAVTHASMGPACNRPRVPSADTAAAWDLPRSCGAGGSPARRSTVPAPRSGACTIHRG